MAWTAFNSLVFGSGKPGKGSIIQNLYNNILSFAKGEAGAPKIETAAYGDKSITGAKIADQTIDWTKLTPNNLVEAVMVDNAVSSRVLKKTFLPAMTSANITSSSTYIVPAGLWMAQIDNISALTVYHGIFDPATQTWNSVTITTNWFGTLFSDGINVRILVSGAGSITLRMRRQS